MKKILFIGAEVMPFAATGGLGDVLGSLPASLAKDKNNDVRVILPLYRAVSNDFRNMMNHEAYTFVDLAWRHQYCGIKSLVKDGVTYYFLDNEYYFGRDNLYGYYDDGERFAFFSKAALDILPIIGFFPDILHANDWQSALCPVYLKTAFAHRAEYSGIKTVFTIHNIEYQGKYDFAVLGDVFGLGYDSVRLLHYDNCINLMKAAIECADRVTTVSPRYSEEILTDEYSHGLRPCLEGNRYKLSGILNGIDYNYYNSENRDIPEPFNWRSLKRKYKCKVSLQRELSLPENENVPMLAVISRLVSHKGLDLISSIAYELVGQSDIQLVILGTGDRNYEEFFKSLEATYPDKVRMICKYDRALSKRIYAAADLFLMPSKSEPCGLSQMIASRYGAIPVTRETGGLYDSIKGYWEHDGKLEGNGFTFRNYSADELNERIRNAVSMYYNDRKLFDKLTRKVMKEDFSWDKSAKQYSELYNGLTE